MMPIKIAFLVPDDRFGQDMPAPHFGAAPTALLQGFKELGGRKVQVHIISCVEKSIHAPPQLEDNIFYHQIVIPHWQFLRSLHLGPILRIRHFLKTMRPDLVHAHGIEKWCAISGAFSGCPSVLTIHGHLGLIDKVAPMEPRAYWKLQMLLGDLSIPRHNGVICISRHIQHAIKKQAKKTWHIPNGVRADFLTPLKPEPQNAVPKLLVLGTIIENKQSLEILRCLRKVAKTGGRFHATFYGQLGDFGDYQRTFRKEMFSAEEEGYASYGGLKSAVALRDEMDQADALLHFPKEEAFGLVVAESLARGLCFFGSRVGGIVDIVQGADNVHLFEPGDFDSVETMLLQWLKTISHRSLNNHNIMISRYSPIDIANAHLDVYTDVLAKQH